MGHHVETPVEQAQGPEGSAHRLPVGHCHGVVLKALAARRPRPLRLYGLSEQCVLKRGLQALFQRFIEHEEQQLLVFAQRANGTSKIQAKSFFERLLRQEAPLQSSMASDVSAAQADVRHLSLLQLLAIRVHTLDFATRSRIHEAHNSFMEMVDRHLFEELAQSCCASCDMKLPAPASPGKASAMWRKVGFQIALAFGVVASLEGPQLSPTPSDSSLPASKPAEQEPSPQPQPGTTLAPGSMKPRVQVPVPPCLAWNMEPTEDVKGPAILDMAASPRPRLLLLQAQGSAKAASPEAADADAGAGPQPDSLQIEEIVAGRPIGVVWDSTSGSGSERTLFWEMAVIAPELGQGPGLLGRAVLEELRAAQTGLDKSALVQELEGVLRTRRRASAPV